jgi:hypothetical protein
MRWTQSQSYLFTPDDPYKNSGVNKATGIDKSAQAISRNLSNYLTPVQLSRLKVDLSEWRRAMSEAELAYNPHRVRMQRMYIDTILNGHVYGLMEARKDLTMLRAYEFAKKQGDKWVKSEDLTQEFEEYAWFQVYMEYVLDAKFFGYSLISLGDIIDGNFAECDIVRRWNVSPDRKVVGSYIYSTSGKSWEDADTMPWHVYVSTPSENGVGRCGYGLFYKIALYEIFLRNTLGFNGDFVELYSQPYRVGKTTKTTESERGELEAAIRNMGSNGWAIIDPLDEITFLETSLGGTGWQGYDNFEMRCQKYVSKIVLGHADGIDSTPGKLGSGQGDDNPVAKAMMAKQKKDARFMLPYINQELLPRMQKFGFKIPEGYKFIFNNDDEKKKQRKEEDESNLATAQIAQTMTSAGMQMKPEYFEERTGIPTELAPTPEADDDMGGGIKPKDKAKVKPDKAKTVKNMMEDLYGKR